MASNSSLEYMRGYYKKRIQDKDFVARRRNQRLSTRLEAIRQYGGVCSCCGEKQMEFLAIDHMEGTEKIKGMRSGNSLYVMLKREGYPNGFRVLCHNCNLAIGFYGYCPHSK